MTVYAIAQLKMTDRAAYDRYQARFFDVFRKYDGRLLTADEQPRVLEGAWPFDKLVMMSFPDEAAFLAFSNSPDYEDISRDRKAGAQATVLLVRRPAASRSPERPEAEHERCRHAVGIWPVVDRPRVIARVMARSGPRNVVGAPVPPRIEHRSPRRGFRLHRTLRRGSALHASNEPDDDGQSDPSRHDHLCRARRADQPRRQ